MNSQISSEKSSSVVKRCGCLRRRHGHPRASYLKRGCLSASFLRMSFLYSWLPKEETLLPEEEMELPKKEELKELTNV